MNNDDTLPLRLARWFEGRLHETLDHADRFDAMTNCRLYGFELLDPHAFERPHAVPARVMFLAAADRLDDLLRDPATVRVRDFDAIALVTSEWLTVPATQPRRPQQHLVRRRARVVEVRHPSGGATVLRFEHEPDRAVVRTAA